MNEPPVSEPDDNDAVIAALVEELKALASAKTQEAVRGSDLPLLREAARSSPSDLQDARALEDVLEKAAQACDDERVAKAAAAIWFGAGRWNAGRANLQVRQKDGAEQGFGVGLSAFIRRPAPGRPSRYEIVLTTLAKTIERSGGLSVEALARAAAGPRTPKPSADAPTSRGGRRRWAAAVAVTVGVIVALLIAAWPRTGGHAGRGGEPATPTPTSNMTPTQASVYASTSPSAAASAPVSCSIAPAQAAVDLPADLVSRLRELAAGISVAVGPASCPRTPVQLVGQGLVQELQRRQDGRRDGAIVIAPGGDPVRLSDAAYAGYRGAFARDRIDVAIQILGYPLSVEETPAGVIVHMTQGVLVGRTETDPFFVIPAVDGAYDTWLQSGGPDGALGLPTSSPMVNPSGSWYEPGQWYLEFERGYLTAPADLSERARFVRPPDPAAPLTSTRVPLTDHILRQFGGTAWYVDGSGVRHWIPDGTTYTCLGGDGAIAVNDVPGYAVWTLPAGPPAVCPPP